MIQIFRGSYLSHLAQRQHNAFIKIDPKRGTIYDRNRHPLALNVAAYSLYANPRAMSKDDKKRATQKLSEILGVKSSFLADRLSRPKAFVWLARKLPPPLAEQVHALEIPGLEFITESKRHYPNQTLAAHVIGFAGMDNQGLEGLEMKYDKVLKGEPGWSQILQDARQRQLLIDRGFIPPKDGFDIILTIDETIQYLAEQALEESFLKHRAIGASIIVMNPKSGEILAIANRPTYDLTRPEGSAPDSRRNRAVSDMYEPGSVFKIVTAAAALEENVIKEEDKIFCENGEFRVANHILHDHHGHGFLTFSEVIEQSSNIGTVKVAQKLGPQRVFKYAQLFRFGVRTNINLPGEIRGVLKNPAQWSKTSIAAIPIGHEVTSSALQVLCALSAIANDGTYMKPYIIREIRDQKGEVIEEFKPTPLAQVIKPETAARLKKILTEVVNKGTGKRAQIPGITVAGKTGTAQKIVGGVYSHSQYYATFIGFAPVENPKIAIIVVFDDPHPDHFGGTVSAPVFQKVAADTLKYLELNPLAVYN